MDPAVHVGSIPAPSYRKFRSASWPNWEWPTSGCHCKPKRRRPRSSKAATGVCSVEAVTAKPSGAACTASPWLIHTTWSAGVPSKRHDPSWTAASVCPYSRVPVRPTVPPSACAIAWKP